MSARVRVFVEGADRGQGARLLRAGLVSFLQRGTGAPVGAITVITGGSTGSTYNCFIASRNGSPSLLLVDSEGPVQGAPSEHVSRHGKGQAPPDDDCHLMVQCMESWLVADAAALEKYFKRGFDGKALPQRDNIEEEPKAEVLSKLRREVAKTPKQKYHKLNHGAVLLGQIDPTVVRQRAPHCDRLLRRLAELTNSART